MGIYVFGRKSTRKLQEVRPSLRRVPELALSWGIMDFSVYEAIRSKAQQNRFYDIGKSRVRWPNGAHNIRNPGDLANAFDLVPFINGRASWLRVHCVALSGILLAAAAVLGEDIRWGGNWDRDGEPITDQDFQDLVHYEKVL